MSWFSEFMHSPLDYIGDHPWKSLALIGGPIAAAAAPWALPEIGAAAGGLFGAGEAGAAAFGGAEAAGAGAAEGGLFGGTDALFGGGGAVGDALGFSPAEGLIGQQAGLGPDAGVTDWISSLGGGGTPDAASGLDAYAAGDGSFADKWAGITGGETPNYASPSPDYSEGIIGSQGSGEAAPPGGMPGEPQGTAWGNPITDGTSGAAADKSFLGGMWDSTKAYATAHPFQAAGAGIAGLGLVNNVLQGQRTSPNMAAMQGNAGAMNQQSQVMMKYLTSGTLPPGLDQAIKLSTQAATANAVANAARDGMPTNPTQNTALAQQLSSIRNNAVADVAKMGVQLMSQGLSMAQISNQLYLQLEQLNRQQARDTGVAIANFAAALNGSGSVRRAA